MTNDEAWEDRLTALWDRWDQFEERSFLDAMDQLTAERNSQSDDLDDAVAAFLALALADSGREREAVSVALVALAPHLHRYQRSVSDYARELIEPTAR